MLSNSWVVHGDHTASGQAHLAFEILAGIEEIPKMHLSEISYADSSEAGATYLGVPGFVSGRSNTSAWS